MTSDFIASLVLRLLKIPRRLEHVVNAYMLTLMLAGPKKTLSYAASVSGLNKSQFSRLLSDHVDLAVLSLKVLATDAAKTAGVDRQILVSGCPWTIAIIIDATLHPRSSLHVHNAQRFNHGQGFVIGHQWTNIVLYVSGQAIPLPPIPFLSKNECKRRGEEYKTEHARVIEYLKSLDLSGYIGTYLPEEVLVLGDAGYDNKLLQRTIIDLGWDFIAALKSSRSSQTEHETKNSPKAWRRINVLFRKVKRQAPWTTVRVETDQGKKRKSFRVRRLIGRIKGVHRDVVLICSKKSTGKGRRYFACSNLKASSGAITRAYRIRWQVELFHRTAKSQLGMLDAGVSDFEALTAHVHWVYCAYLILQKAAIPNAPTLLEKQRALQRSVEREPILHEVKRILVAPNQFGGRQRQESLLRAVLQAGVAA